MDDAYCICETREQAEAFLKAAAEYADRMGLKLNPSKTAVAPIKRSKPVFLKRTYSYVPPEAGGGREGRLEVRMSACAVRASRKHLKNIARLRILDVLPYETEEQVRASIRSVCLSTSHSAGLARKLLNESGLGVFRSSSRRAGGGFDFYVLTLTCSMFRHLSDLSRPLQAKLLCESSSQS